MFNFYNLNRETELQRFFRIEFKKDYDNLIKNQSSLSDSDIKALLGDQK